MSPTPKKIRSSSPDVIVAVGQGDGVQEFECYKIALSFASAYFDAMLSADMAESNSSRIAFPDKDPEEWKLFYQFIDPNQIGEVKNDVTIDEKNAPKLVPWFNEFQMGAHVEECDKVLSTFAEATNLLFWDKKKYSDADVAKKEKMAMAFRGIIIIKLLQCACLYDLKKTKTVAESFLYEIFGETCDVFDRPTISVLVELFLPLREDDFKGVKCFESSGKSGILWRFLVNSEFRMNYLEGLSVEDINNSKTFPLLVESFLHTCATREASWDMEELANGIISQIMGTFPGEMYNRLPDRNNDRRLAARGCMMDMMRHHFQTYKESHNRIGIRSLPDSYS